MTVSLENRLLGRLRLLTHVNTHTCTQRAALWSVKLLVSAANKRPVWRTEHCLVEKPEIANQTRRSFIPGDL